MAADDDSPSPIALLAIAINPLLIMLMVGSLVWFLVDVFYQGQYSGRLLWSLSFFVAGAVLIARIAIELGASRATVYAAALGGAVFLAMLRFVDYPNSALAGVGPLVNIGLLALVWWLVNKLTWDCTHLQEDQSVSGRGLLSAVGLDGASHPESDDAVLRKAARRKKHDATGIAGWWARWQRVREARRQRPHTPGTWVLYFALLALPVFMLGQALIPAADQSRRWSTLVEMAVFVGSGLGLLMSTSLLGLREYLRERNARLPLTPLLAWLGFGAGLIVFGLAVSALLPRPHQEWNGLPELTKSSNRERESSPYAWRDDGESGRNRDPDSDSSATAASQPGGGARNPRQSSEQSLEKSNNSASTGGEKSRKSRATPSKDGNTGPMPRGQQPGNSPDPGMNDGTRQSPENKSGSTPETSRGSPAKSSASANDRRAQDASESSAKTAESASESESDTRSAADLAQSTRTMTRLRTAAETASRGVKWLVWIVIAVILLGGLVYALLNWLAPFTDWARNLLAWFRWPSRGRRGDRSQQAAEASERDESPRLPPFSEFSNPFTDGSSRRRNPRELVIYTFTALDSWAVDRRWDRQPGETPTEFVTRLGEAVPTLRESSARLASLLAQALYSRSVMPAETRRMLAEFWRLLEREYLPRTEPPG